MKKLTDFANIAQLQTYIKDWNSLTGLSAAITDLDGNCLTTAIPEILQYLPCRRYLNRAYPGRRIHWFHALWHSGRLYG